MMGAAGNAEQLSALSALVALLECEEIDYWVFGGWAVDFHAGRVTRNHDDLDLAVWERDYDTIDGAGWHHAPDPDEDGYTGYERVEIRVELAFLASGDDRAIYTPTKQGRATWPEGAFSVDVRELDGNRARVIGLAALMVDKSTPHGDAVAAAKDRADYETLDGLR